MFKSIIPGLGVLALAFLWTVLFLNWLSTPTSHPGFLVHNAPPPVEKSAPEKNAQRPNRLIKVLTATYGASCGAPTGNATQIIGASCDGKTTCSYTVDVNRLGDPAGGCGKNFIINYMCPPDATLRHVELPAEAGFGSIANLSCGESGQ